MNWKRQETARLTKRAAFTRVSTETRRYDAVRLTLSLGFGAVLQKGGYMIWKFDVTSHGLRSLRGFLSSPANELRPEQFGRWNSTDRPVIVTVYCGCDTREDREPAKNERVELARILRVGKLNRWAQAVALEVADGVGINPDGGETKSMYIFGVPFERIHKLLKFTRR